MKRRPTIWEALVLAIGVSLYLCWDAPVAWASRRWTHLLERETG